MEILDKLTFFRNNDIAEKAYNLINFLKEKE